VSNAEVEGGSDWVLYPAIEQFASECLGIGSHSVGRSLVVANSVTEVLLELPSSDVLEAHMSREAAGQLDHVLPAFAVQVVALLVVGQGPTRQLQQLAQVGDQL